MNENINKPILLVEGLSKSVNRSNISSTDSLNILKNITFSVLSGESCAIVGPSGSGKSTLLGLIAGLDIPTQGRVIFDNTDIFAYDEDTRAKIRGEKLGFVFQSFLLLPTLTALENVMLPLEIARRSNIRQTATTVLSRVELQERLSHYPNQLSGGEQQRVAIARAFAPKPSLLCADEPTGNLDSKTGATVIDLLFELNKEHGTTLLLVTHDQELAKRCDRTFHLDSGCLV
jgi:putative ABC transport system ATP-binding protein